jgi:phage baseplate assembly protein V
MMTQAHQVLSTVLQRLRMVIGRGRITFGDDSGNVQRLQVRLNADQINDDMPRLAEFGFTSMPPNGSDVVVVFIAGDRSTGAVVATGHQTSRLKNLKSGEVAIYDDQGQSVYLTRGGIVINGAGLPLTITNTPEVRMETSLNVTGDIKDHCDSPSGKTMAGMRTTYNGHTHNDPQGGAVGQPNQQM